MLSALAFLSGTISAQLPPGREEVVGQLSENTNRLNMQYVIDGAAQHLAWIDGDRKAAGVVALDGKPGPKFDAVHAPTISVDGSRFAYLARQGKKWSVVVDGKIQPGAHDGLALAFFSRDGQRFAYAYLDGKDWRYVLDGEPVGGVYTNIAMAMISHDGKRFVFVAEKKKVGWVVVLDGKEITAPDGKGYCQVGGMTFSPDGKRFAFAGLHRKGFSARMKGEVVVDGQPVTEFESAIPGNAVVVCGYVHYLGAHREGVSPLLWKEDGASLVYAVRRDKDDTVVVNAGEAGPAFESIIAGPVLSPTGQVGYIAWQNDRMIEVVNGKRIRDFPAERGLNFVHYLRFAPGSDRLAYVVNRGGGLFAMGTTRRARRRMVVDGKDGPVFDVTGLTDVLFTEDGRHHLYVIHDVAEDHDAIVFDGVQGPATMHIISNTLRLREGKTLTYFARRGLTILRVTHTLP